MSNYLNNSYIFPVREFTSWKKRTWLDRIIQVRKHTKAYVWFKTCAPDPKLVIYGLKNNAKYIEKMKPQGKSEEWTRYLFMGETAAMSSGTFYEIRLYGISKRYIDKTYLIISLDENISRRKLASCSTTAELEAFLWGISGKAAGSSSICPDVQRVGTSGEYVFSYRSGKQLDKGNLIRIIFNRIFTHKVKFDFAIDKGISKIDSGKNVMLGGKQAIVFTVNEKISKDEELTFRFSSPMSPAFPCVCEDNSLLQWYNKFPILIFEISVDGGKNYASPLMSNSHKLEFIPDQAEQLHLFLPGRRRKGKNIKLRGVITDKYRNPTTENCNKFDHFELQLHNNKQIFRLGKIAEAKIDVNHLKLTLHKLKDGIYRVVAVDENGRRVSISNPLEINSKSDKDEIYWGGVHDHASGIREHTRMSDGLGTIADAYHRARYDAVLDFACVAEHGAYYTDNQWQDIQELISECHYRNNFITLFGYEWNACERMEKESACYHINIYSSRKLPRYNGLDNIEKVLNKLRKRGNTVCETHHAGKKIIDVWKFSGIRQLLKLYEIYRCDGFFEKSEPGLAEFAYELLQTGEKIGFIAGGDSHCGYCAFGPKPPKDEFGKVSCGAELPHLYPTGITAVMAEKLDRQSIINSMRQMRVYATTGPRILIDYSVSGITMGADAETDEVKIKATIHACEKLRKITIIRDGEPVHEIKPNCLDYELSWQDRTVAFGKHYYYLRLEQEDDEFAWTSPVWLNLKN